MMGRIAIVLTAGASAAVWALPAAAQAKQTADAGAQVCELEWNASFGSIALTQRVSVNGDVVSDNLTVTRAISDGNGLGSSLVLSEVGSHRQYTLWLGGPSRRGKNQRLVFAVPGGEPLVVAADQGAYRVSLDQAQLAYLLSAPGKVSYRLIKHDNKGREKAQLAEGQLDLSPLAGQDLAGLPEAAKHARAVLAQARSMDNAPCAMAWAADMNAAYNSEPARKWLSFDCGEEWSGSLGYFGLQPATYVWRPRTREEVLLQFNGSLPIGVRTGPQNFIDNRDDLARYGMISIHFLSDDWRMNFRGKDQAVWQRQSGELSRGNVRVGNALTPAGVASFSWSDFSKLLADQGDLTISARDSVSGLRFDTVLPWNDIAGAEAELRAGQARLRGRERDPLAKCKPQLHEESGMEEEIVT